MTKLLWKVDIELHNQNYLRIRQMVTDTMSLSKNPVYQKSLEEAKSEEELLAIHEKYGMRVVKKYPELFADYADYDAMMRLNRMGEQALTDIWDTVFACGCLTAEEKFVHDNEENKRIVVTQIKKNLSEEDPFTFIAHEGPGAAAFSGILAELMMHFAEISDSNKYTFKEVVKTQKRYADLISSKNWSDRIHGTD